MDGLVVTDADRRRYARRHRAGRIALYVIAVVSALAAAGPFVWAAITAFKQDSDLYRRRNNPFVFNETPTNDHIDLLFNRTGFATFAWNTLWVGVLVVLITLVLSLPAAYSLARLDRPWSGRMGIAIFFV
jgi:multiple sugar transport system permease protein